MPVILLLLLLLFFFCTVPIYSSSSNHFPPANVYIETLASASNFCTHFAELVIAAMKHIFFAFFPTSHSTKKPRGCQNKKRNLSHHQQRIMIIHRSLTCPHPNFHFQSQIQFLCIVAPHPHFFLAKSIFLQAKQIISIPEPK